MPGRSLSVLILCAALTLSTSVYADATIVFENDSGEETRRTYVKNGHVRYEEPSAPEYRRIAVFDVEDSTLFYVSHRQKKVIRVTEQDWERVRQAIEDAQVVLKAIADLQRSTLAKKPPEDRPKIQKTIDDIETLIAEADARLSIRLEVSYHPGSPTTMDGLACVSTTVRENGTAVSNVCVADREELGLSAEDYRALGQLSDFFKTLMYRYLSDTGPGGFVVRETDLRSGSVRRLRSIDSTSLDASLFQLPADYTRVGIAEFFQEER